MKRNYGFTLVELIVGIAIASIVTASATTLLLLGLRMNKASSDTATRQNTARIVLTVLEDLASEQNVELESGSETWKVKNGNSILFFYESNSIYIGNSLSTPIMTDIVNSKVSWADGANNLLKIEIETKEGKYESLVYCRLAQTKTSESVPQSGSSENQYSMSRGLDSLISATKLESTLPARQNFLDILTAELGSTGISLTTGEYFSEWYIGSYEENPAWGPETPWCACFLSWALEQCGGDIRGWVPRYANVDEFLKSFDRDNWKTEAPEPGDIVFFDWQAPYDDPEHVGAVTEVRDGYVYTIEGNSNGKVEHRCYSLDDPRILGYGILNWK